MRKMIMLIHVINVYTCTSKKFKKFVTLLFFDKFKTKTKKIKREIGL